VDTGAHALAALEAAARLTPDTEVRFAALAHDLGKGATPPAAWPSHVGHESRGVERVESLCQRYPIPNSYRELAVLVARYHSHCHRAAELKPVTLLKTLESLDAFRRPARLEKFLLACEADARGRKGREGDTYAQAERMRAARDAAAAVATKPLLEAGLRGPGLGLELHRQRVAAIRDMPLHGSARD
jgi:tRNA nucleotidyltransferase (CCA-adding enzyme)